VFLKICRRINRWSYFIFIRQTQRNK